MDLSSRFRTASELLATHRDVLDARPADGEPPAPLTLRGWSSFLAALDDEQLARLEIEGAGASWPAATPSSLRVLLDEARAACAFPVATLSSERTPRRLETPRKSAQIDAFASLLLPLAARAARVLDVGSGHGHLTRELAERLSLPVVGLERDARITARARSLGGADFAELDVLRDGLPVSPGDCLVGLHACGQLGDAIVLAATERRASVGLLGCCLQKRLDDARRPLCPEVADREALLLPKRLLGLSNLTARDEGVEASREQNLRARERRLALHHLLVARLGPMRFGQEIDGLNRRTAHLELDELVRRAFSLRRLSAPSPVELAAAATWAARAHARARRFSLPRAMLARVLEVFVLTDRARWLEGHGFTVELSAVFPAEVSPRNLGLFAEPQT